MSIPRSLFFLGFLIWGVGQTAQAQTKRKAHINLPDITDTLENVLSVHEDFNFYADVPVALATTTFDFGLTDNWDIGLGVFNFPLDSFQDYSIPVLINVEKSITLHPRFSILAGTNIGWALTAKNVGNGINSYNYITGSTLIYNINLGLGAYYANQWFAGYNSVGISGNLIVPINNRWKLQYDFLSGTNNISGSNYQFFYSLSHDTSLGFGIQMQYNNRQEVLSGILSINYR
ncbi:MAG: hypothetical protein WC782_06595 [Methylococcaceae bacterium]|jgi:hypothetical protein